MIYAVIDTNVLVAAAKTHKPDSSTSRILSLVFDGIIQPLVCEEMTKFKEDGIDPGRTPSPEEHPDPTDQVFYEICLSVEDAYLVTNNRKHFPNKPQVVTPTEMLVLLVEAGVI